MDSMISAEEAIDLVRSAARPTGSTTRALVGSAGYHLAAAVEAPHDHPLFPMSAVDGYAFAFNGDGPWTIVHSLQAGEVLEEALKPGECARIFTGAMLPAGADTVVMQEYVKVEAQRMHHADTRLVQGANVRQRAEQIRAGQLLLHAGKRLGPAEIGLLASTGVHTVRVHRKPLVDIVRTGGEFTSPEAPQPGRIFSSNDHMLAAALADEGLAVNALHTPADELGALKAALGSAARADVIITTGGVSVGDHDLVRTALEQLGARIIFHGVGQKPGKPMLFAQLGDSFVFGLPGNPRAVLVAWWIHVRPFLRALQGAAPPPAHRLPLAHPVMLKGTRAEIRAARLDAGQVHLLADEGSHMLSTLVTADALAILPAGMQELNAGHPVEVHYLPQR
jgi:molybdopterin molybdotransferase